MYINLKTMMLYITPLRSNKISEKHYIIFRLKKYIILHDNHHQRIPFKNIQLILVKSHMGVGFCFHFSAEASPKQNPTQSFFFRNLISGFTLERDFEIKDEKVSKRPKIHWSITSMFCKTGPKFVETIGKQLLCPCCGYKFRAPQGCECQKCAKRND